jgi:mannose-6-phosphate isomerase-like protein (cupin superfamily)
MDILQFAVSLFGVVAVVWTAGCLVDRLRPEPPPPDFLYPRVGQVIHSEAEGFTSRIIKTDKNDTWLELTLAPHAPGPPRHVHTRFAEDFIVAKGVLSLRVGGEIKQLRPGEHFLVQPGVVHQPFNATNEEVVVRGPLTPEYALPRDFVLFLCQIYGFIDESPVHARPPAILLQASIFAPRYDSWLADSPLLVQRVEFTLLRPLARLLGYRSYYPRFLA